MFVKIDILCSELISIGKPRDKETKIREYEQALDVAAGFYREIQRLVATESNDYNLDVMKRLSVPHIFLDG